MNTERKTNRGLTDPETHKETGGGGRQTSRPTGTVRQRVYMMDDNNRKHRAERGKDEEVFVFSGLRGNRDASEGGCPTTS